MVRRRRGLSVRNRNARCSAVTLSSGPSTNFLLTEGFLLAIAIFPRRRAIANDDWVSKVILSCRVSNARSRT
ncbi:MAG: hypothetical protein AAFU78_21320 [Cyanobacteria bacterium J06633_2]